MTGTDRIIYDKITNGAASGGYDIDTAMAARLRQVRKALGMKQGDFAKGIGLTQNSLSIVELGKSVLTDKNIKLICMTYNIKETWIRDGTGNMFWDNAPCKSSGECCFKLLSAESQAIVFDLMRHLAKLDNSRGT